MNKVVKQLGGKIGMQGSLRAVSSDNNGHIKAIREESAEVSALADYNKGYTQETVIARTKMKPNSVLAVATRFLNEYNHLNSISYKVSSTQPNQNNIADIIAIDETTKKS